MGARIKGTRIVPFPVALEPLQVISVKVILNIPILTTFPTTAVETGTFSEAGIIGPRQVFTHSAGVAGIVSSGMRILSFTKNFQVGPSK